MCLTVLINTALAWATHGAMHRRTISTTLTISLWGGHHNEGPTISTFSLVYQGPLSLKLKLGCVPFMTAGSSPKPVTGL